MKETLRYQYGGLLDAWRDGWAGEVWRSGIAFCLVILLSFGACMLLPNLRELLVGYVMELFGGMNLTTDSGRLSALALFFNNVQATTVTMVYGLLPFIQLPALALGMNAMLLGVLSAHYVATGASMSFFLAGLLPHGLFEFPALILAFSMGLYVCGQLSRRVRKDETAHGFSDCLVLISRTLLLVLVPLLAASAVVEAYVTPLIAALFL